MVKDAVPLGECGRALVVKLRHHGDVLLAAPVLSVLKAHAPAIEVDALVYDDTAPMLAGHPALSRLHVIGRRWRSLGALARLRHEHALFRELRARRYDLIVHLSEQPRGAWLARTLGARFAVGPVDRARGGWWHKSFTHLYPLVRNPALADRLADEGHRVVMTSAPDEIGFIDEILGKMRSQPVNLAGKLSLKELGALIARARLFIGVDSMPMHLAAAMGVPTVALFGPSSEVVWGPWNVEQRVVTTTHSCRPCGVDGCGGSKVSECLTLLGVEPVHAAAQELLAK